MYQLLQLENKAYSVFGIIKHNFDNLSADAFLMLCKSVFAGLPEYCRTHTERVTLNTWKTFKVPSIYYITPRGEGGG